ncbi:MAG: hypothetical protein IPM21_04100 [Acidobacteria bacterium]|nr:hypothetical protein [Acidobacteriota bacterium]
MYKLILGIVTIGVLQFALMLYLQMQQPAEKQVAQLRPALSNALPAAVQQEETRLEDGNPPESATEPERVSVRPSERATFNNSRKARRSVAERTPIRTAEQAKFDTVVIGYNVPPPRPDCGSPNNIKPTRKESTQFAATSAPRWKVVKTEALSFE